MNGLDIKNYRKRNKLTQEQLAGIVKSTVRAVQSWEQDQRGVPQSAMTLMELHEQSPEVDKGDITMPREVFEQINKLTETVLSQQRTIENLTQKGVAGVAGAARKAVAG